jgi:purine-binding chemotaxis protein CheW
MTSDPFPAVLFTVRSTRLAIAASAVSAVHPVALVVRPPGSPPALAGFLDLAGEAVPVVALARLLDLPDPERVALSDHLLVLPEAAVPAGRLALLVDRVDDLVVLDPAAVAAVDPRDSHGGCVGGAVEVAGRRVLLTDPARLLAARERDRLGAIARAEEARRAAFADP